MTAAHVLPICISISLHKHPHILTRSDVCLTVVSTSRASPIVISYSVLVVTGFDRFFTRARELNSAHPDSLHALYRPNFQIGQIARFRCFHAGLWTRTAIHISTLTWLPPLALSLVPLTAAPHPSTGRWHLVQPQTILSHRACVVSARAALLHRAQRSQQARDVRGECY